METEIEPEDVSKEVSKDEQSPDSAPVQQDSVNLELYEQSVRNREADLLNHTAPHNQTRNNLTTKLDSIDNMQNNYQNGSSSTPSSNGDSSHHNDLADISVNQANNFVAQNGHSKNQINELNNFINNSENQYNSMAVDNAV
jgi:hypothetical protein